MAPLSVQQSADLRTAMERQGLQRGEAEEALAAMQREMAAAQEHGRGQQKQAADAAAEVALQEFYGDYGG